MLLNNIVVEHCDEKNTNARSLFQDFSSACDTLKPASIITIWIWLSVSLIVCWFMLAFLIKRTPCVRINDILSDVLTINIGGPKVACYLPYYYNTTTNNNNKAVFNLIGNLKLGRSIWSVMYSFPSLEFRIYGIFSVENLASWLTGWKTPRIIVPQPTRTYELPHRMTIAIGN